MEKNEKNIAWEKLTPKELIGGIEKSLNSYSPRDKNIFNAWRSGYGKGLKETLFRDWISFHDYLDLGDYNLRSSDSSWTPESFEDEAVWILTGVREKKQEYKAKLVEPGIQSNGEAIKTLDQALDLIYTHQAILNFPCIRIGNRNVALSLNLDRWSIDVGDGYESEYSFSCSRKLEDFK